MSVFRPLVLAITAICFADRVPAALTDHLVGLYEFESSFLDTSGSPQPSHGTPANGPQFTAGKIGQAMWLPGVRDAMTLNPTTLTELDVGSTVGGDAVDFSASMWIRQDNFLSDPAVFSNKNWASGNNTGINWAVNGNGVFDLNTKGDVGARRDLDTAANSAPLAVGAWNLVVMTVDRDGPTRLYINGVNTGTIPASSLGDFNSGLPWTVGQDGTGNYAVEFTGAVDDLAIWRRALSPTEAGQLWNGGAGIDLKSQIVEARLKLVVDRGTGAMTIENNTGAAQDLIGYQITSIAGTLNRAAWTPVAGRLDDAGNGTVDVDDNWVVLTAPGSVSDLSEASLGAGVLAAGASIDLGVGAWGKYHQENEDLQFLYADPVDDDATAGLVEFVGNGGQSYSPLDLNFDGLISLPDYAAFLAVYGTNLTGKSSAQQYNLGDLNRDGKHSALDFLAFKRQFDDLRGPGALEAAIAAGGIVPEPSSVALAAAALGVAGAVARRRSAKLIVALAPRRRRERPSGL